MNYKLFITDQLEEQSLYYDPASSLYSKLTSDEDLSDKELDTLLKRIGYSKQMINQKLNHIKNLLNLLTKHLIYTDYDKAEFVYSEITAYADFISYTPHHVMALLLKNRFHIAKYEYDKIPPIHKALKKKRKEFTPLEELLYEYLLGLHEMLKGELASANDRLDLVIQSTPTLFGFEGEVYYHLSIVKTYLEEPSRAIYYGKKALDYLSQQYNYKRILHAQMSLAINCAHAKIYEDAAEYYEHLLRNAQLLNQQELIPHIYHNMGDLYYKMGNYSMALAYFNMAVNQYGKEDLQFGNCLFNLGLTELELKKKDDAKATFTRLLEVSERFGFENFRIYANYYLLELDGQIEESMKYLENVLLPYTSATPTEKTVHLLFSDMLVRYYKNKGQYKKAFSYITDEKYNEKS